VWLTIDPRSHTPMYQQIIDDIKVRIAKGALATGSKLPSIRELAVDITINPNTIAKAYQELEREGVIEVIRGKGTFVSSLAPVGDKAIALGDIREKLTMVLVESHHLGVAFTDVAKVLQQLITEWHVVEEGNE
jgi:GntR family transcriptional regulator